MTGISQPVPIKSPRVTGIIDNDSQPGSYTPSSGTPILRGQLVGTPTLPNIPRRPSFAIPTVDGPSSFRAQLAVNSNASGTATPIYLDLDEVPDEEKVKVVARHLILKDATDEVDASGPSSSSIHETESSDMFSIPYHAPGADITHDIYKWHADKSRARARAVSFSGPSQTPDPAFEHIHEPGGFRRNYVLLRASDPGVLERPILNNFIDFLLLYGHFAGEDLEDDEDSDDIEQNTMGFTDERGDQYATERSLLLPSQQKTRSRRRATSVGSRGTATVAQAVLMMLKSFIGTGILFLGKAFYNGGLVFSSVTFIIIAAVSLYSFLLLVRTKFAVSGSFGELGGKLYGPWMRYLILSSIVISQIGFGAAYMIFVAQNLQAFFLGVTHCLKLIPIHYLILSQVIVFLPLVLVRNLAKLSAIVLIADVFILFGIVYITGSEISILAQSGIADVKWFNPKDFSLFIGTAVFSFEGIGLILPITDSMKEPHKFPAVLTGVMAFITVLFGGAGVLGYLAFGSDVQTVILVNLDVSNPTVRMAQLVYAISILLSVPLQLFPVVRILENGLFSRSGKMDIRVKWYKNLFRFSTVALCTAISWYGAADLDKFVALIGSFACVPLCYMYPAMLHYKACARTRGKKLADIAMVLFGFIAAVYTTLQTIQLMMTPEINGPPQLGSCST